LVSSLGCCSGVVVSLPMHVSESGDEALGNVSPEPLSVITVTTDGHSVVNSEVVELRRQLERERHTRVHLEKQIRAIQSQLYPDRFRDNQLIAYQPHEVRIARWGWNPSPIFRREGGRERERNMMTSLRVRGGGLAIFQKRESRNARKLLLGRGKKKRENII